MSSTLKMMTEKFKLFTTRHATILVLICMVIIMGIIKPLFLSAQNIINVLLQVAIIGTVSTGMTFVILTGGIDLSVGAILGLSGMMAAMVANHGIFIALLVALSVGAVFGFFNGLISFKLKMQSFIVTLSTMSIARGINFIVSKGQNILFYESLDKYKAIASGYIGPIPTLSVIWLSVTFICLLITTFTKYGRYILAIGGNQEAAFLTGINVSLIKISAFTICGLLSGLSGFLQTSYFSSGIPLAGTGFELDAIASVVIGGTHLSGGKGSIAGTIAGVLIFGILGNMFNLLNISSYVQMVAKGILILTAVYVAARTVEQPAVVK